MGKKGKLSNVQIANSTISILEAGYYKNPTNNLNVSIRKQVEASVNGSKMYSGEDCEELKKTNQYSLNKGHATEFEVCQCTTLEAAERLTTQYERVAALNFASAKFPGGGFKTGAKAQEESLARSSALYNCLKKHPKFYSANKRENNCVYTNNIIYSPDVPFFRKDNGDLLPEPYLLSVLSAPAVHYGSAHKKLKRTTILEDTMKQRAHYILSICADRGHEVLVLGAWGCGVFKFPVDECAGLFYDLLAAPDAPFKYTFQKVVFAIVKPQFIEVFEEWFEEDEEEEEETEDTGDNTTTTTTTTTGEGEKKSKKRRERKKKEEGDDNEDDEDENGGNDEDFEDEEGY